MAYTDLSLAPSTTAARRTVGVLGGGPLALATAGAARRLGFDVHRIDAAAPDALLVTPGDAAVHVARVTAMVEACAECSAVVPASELVPPWVLRAVEREAPLRPGREILELARDRALERRWLEARGVGVLAWHEAGSRDEAAAAAAVLGGGCWVKPAVRRGDDTAAVRVDTPREAAEVWTAIGGGRAVLEVDAAVDVELVVAVARTADDVVTVLPPVMTGRSDGRLDWAVLPAPVPAAVERRVRELGAYLARRLELVGVVAIELFVLANGRLVVNELVAGPHPAYLAVDHGCRAGQLEQLVRVAVGLPPAATDVVRPTAAVFLYGAEVADPRRLAHAAAQIDDCHVELFDGRPGELGERLGHVTTWADTLERAMRQARVARRRLLLDAATPLAAYVPWSDDGAGAAQGDGAADDREGHPTRRRPAA